MEPTRVFAVISLITLPAVMFGGYSLRRFMERGPRLSAFQRIYFRAGHAYAGVLTVLSLVYYQYLDQTTFDDGWKWLACAVLAVGILAQSGGFFLHMAVSEEGRPSTGTLVTSVGAVLLAAAVIFLAYALVWQYPR